MHAQNPNLKLKRRKNEKIQHVKAMNLKIESGKTKANKRKTEKIETFLEIQKQKVEGKRERFFPERNKQKIK